MKLFTSCQNDAIDSELTLLTRYAERSTELFDYVRVPQGVREPTPEAIRP